MHRDAFGKVGNFQIAYGASENSLERSVEAAMERKLDEHEQGVGLKMLDAYERRAPIATRFLQDMERIPEDPGYWQAASGRYRHFHMAKLRGFGVSGRTRQSIMSSLSREMRNFPMQNVVADTLAKASYGVKKEYEDTGMRARPAAVLYDAMLTLCPIPERERVAHLHHKWLHKETYWDVAGGRLRFTIETDYCMRWSTAMTKEEHELLGDPPEVVDLPLGE
jgi:DNA polymerase I-like protein with 3'-5' exonuclease and polymerase domains